MRIIIKKKEWNKKMKPTKEEQRAIANKYFNLWQNAKKEQRDKVALLRQLTTDLHHRFPKGIIWRENCDTVCDMCEEYVHKKIEEVFGKDEDKNG
jgi:hypothetical protein